MRGNFMMFILASTILACGVEGPPGPVGPQGPKGDPGTLLQSATLCDSPIVQVGTNLFLGFSLYRWDFSDGSVLTECLIEDGASTYSTMNLYKPSMPGATRGGCILMYDVNGSEGGFWDFAVQKGGVNGASVTYTDPGSAIHGRTVTFSCDNR